MKRLDSLSASLKRKKDFAFIKALQTQHPDAEVFLVGGIIRDTLLKRESKDYDFVVRSVPLRALQRQLEKLGTVNVVGRTFGVIKLLPKQSSLREPIDIALPRKDHALGTGGYKDVTTQSNPRLPIEEDLLRRDFTINALAMRVDSGELIDPSGGLRDLRAKRLRTVGKPRERFREDFTRMLRGIRFSCQLGFTLESATRQAISNLARNLAARRDNAFIVPREMIAQELIKAFVANPVQALDLVEHTGVVKTLLPELLKMKGCPQPRNFHIEGDVWKHTRMALAVLSSAGYKRRFGTGRPNAEVVLGTLFHDLGKPYTIKTPAKDGVDRIRFNNHDMVGAQKAHQIMTRLSFSVFPRTDERYHVDPDRIAWIIKYHLVGFRNDILNMRATTVEQYFLSTKNPSESLLKVQYADTAATIHAGGEPDFTGFRAILRRVAAIKRQSKGHKNPPPPLVTGHDVMDILHIPSGPEVGTYLTKVRELQLRGKLQNRQAARAWLNTQKPG